MRKAAGTKQILTLWQLSANTQKKEIVSSLSIVIDSRMKKNVQYLLAAFLFLCSTALLAQTLNVTQGKVRNEESQDIDGWVTLLDQPADYANNTFEDFIKQTYGGKVTKRGKTVLVFEKAKVPEIINLRGDLRAVFTPSATGVSVGFTFSPGYDIHITKDKYPAELAKIEALVKKYTKFHYQVFYKGQITKAEKSVTDKRNDISRKEKKMGSLRETIADNEKRISNGDSKSAKLAERNTKNNEEIASLTGEVSKLQEEITQLQASIDGQNEALKKVMNF